MRYALLAVLCCVLVLAGCQTLTEWLTPTGFTPTVDKSAGEAAAANLGEKAGIVGEVGGFLPGVAGVVVTGIGWLGAIGAAAWGRYEKRKRTKELTTAGNIIKAVVGATTEALHTMPDPQKVALRELQKKYQDNLVVRDLVKLILSGQDVKTVIENGG